MAIYEISSKVLIIGILSILQVVECLYPSNSDVVQLTDSTFQNVINSDQVWLVEFFAPWCGHCQQLVPEYTKVASALKGIAKVGAIDSDTYKQAAGQYGVSGFPTIKIFGFDKKKPINFNGPRTAQGLADAVMKAVREKLDAQLGGKKSSGGGKSGGKSDVIELTDSNFDELVLKSDDMWLVEFYAPWCGHCKNLAPHWESAATELKGKVKLGALDATVHTIKAQKYGIKGFPTIKYFPGGPKDDSYEDYDGGRTSSDIVNWASEKVAENIPAPEIKQITSSDVMKEYCFDHPLCVVSILPHILDCQSSCRNKHLDMLNSLGEKYKKKMWGWVWAEAGTQPDIESALEIGGFGYPALTIVSAKKLKYATFKGSFSQSGINEFLRDVSYGKGSTTSIRGSQLPNSVETDPWDGKDGVLDETEDIDLSDVELEPLDKDEL